MIPYDNDETFDSIETVCITPLYRKTMGFFEVTGGFRLDSVLEGTPPRKVEPPARREGC
ncbi:MAG: hypothetical protein R6T98_02320 [Desulfatiglandales bacterium]